MCYLLTSLLIVLIYFELSVTADTLCGDDWVAYKDEKCIKILENVQSYEEAMSACIQYSSALLTIASSDEQKFIENYISRNAIIDYVWIGLKYVNSKYQWINALEANYTNWSEGSPKNNSEYCVQLNSDQLLLGKWSDISCSKKNLAMCQKLPTITLQQLHYLFIDMRNRLEITETTLANTKKQFDYFFSDKWIHFKTFNENNTRKALIYPFKSQSRVLRSEAIEICGQSNATLVDIESYEKQQLVESFLSPINTNIGYNFADYWISGYRSESGKYKWLTSGSELNYTNWYPGNPIHNYSYVTMHTDGLARWGSNPITYTCKMFCEISFNF